MNPASILAILALINGAIKLGGDILPIALKAYSALRAESGLSDDELTSMAATLNNADNEKLLALIAETGG